MKKKGKRNYSNKLGYKLYCMKGIRKWIRCMRCGLKEVEDVLCGKQ